MVMQIKNLNMTFPDGFASKHFMDSHSAAPISTAFMQMLNHQLKARPIIFFIHHNV
jgi:hypothetical protein